MKKILVIVAVSLGLGACGARTADPYDRDLTPSELKEGMKQQQKDKVSAAKDANKFKCQDARLDLVDAEAEGDINIIRQVKARVQRLCVTEK